MKLGLVFSNDWELFGDGSGDYFAIQHRPLEQLLSTFDSHGAKLTVMAEVGQQLAHRHISEEQGWAREIVEAWEAILRETIRKNHDVQLHLHPQWHNAEYTNGRWNVDFRKWAISTLEPGMINEIVTQGKAYLDSILKPVDASYECIAFRAGAYCLQPSKVVMQELLSAGILCDTSVTKGMHVPGFYDYRDAYSNCVPWFASPDDIRCKSDKGDGLLEIPIYSHQGIDAPILRKYLWPGVFYGLFFGVRLSKEDREWIARNNQKRMGSYPLSKRALKTGKMHTARWVLSKVIAKSGIQLDYDSLPPKVFARCLEKVFAEKAITGVARDVIPIMATGHTKDMHTVENIDRILREVNKRLKGRIVYWTLRDAITYWLGNEQGNHGEAG